MLLIKFSVIVVFSVILVTTNCRARIVSATSGLDEATFILFRNLANIVTSCYKDRIDGIGVAGDFPDTFLRTLSVQHSIPTVLIDDTKHDPQFMPVQLRRKLQIFIVRTESVEQLATIITNIKYSIWWNHVAAFFIIDRSSSCDYATIFLLRAWFDDVLHAKVMCYYRKSTPIYGYNPFKSQAPYPWVWVSVEPGITTTRHPFTTFARRYEETKEICEEQDFDKTKDMAGYAIVTEGNIPHNLSLHRKNQTFTNEFVTVQNRILHTAFRALNGNPQYLEFGKLNGHVYADMIRDPFSMVLTWITRKTSYPHAMSGFVIISRFRGHKSQLEKILYVIDVDSRIGLGVVYLITLIFFKFFVQQTLLPALLNLIRITCNTGFANLPDNNASRMYLTGLLFFVVTIQGIYQGNLASLLTTVIPYRDANTMQDLVTLDYKKIYIYEGDSVIFKYCQDTLVYPERCAMYNTYGAETCVSYVNNDSLAACLAPGHGRVLDEARKFKMHVSNKLFSMEYNCYLIRWDWPLEERFNAILSSMVEADVLEPWNLKCNPSKLCEFEFDEEVMNNKVFKQIEFHELRFSFVILAVGIICSTITFIIELAVHRFQSRTLNVRSMYPRGVRTFLL